MTTETPPPIDRFRAAAFARKRRVGACERCGRPFEGLARRRFCSGSCRALSFQEHRRKIAS